MTNQLDNNQCLSPIDIDPISSIYIEDLAEETDVKEAKLTTSADNQSLPQPHQCKWCHLVAKCVTNASAPTQLVNKIVTNASKSEPTV